MRKLYYKLCRLVGYTFLFEHTWSSNFEYQTKYTHLTLYKYIGMYDAKYGGMKLKTVWTIKIKNI
jgi:hypothetical protein